MNAEHCWHEYLGNSVSDKCCYCGKKYRERMPRMVKREGHGPHLPSKRIYDDRSRREVGPCPERPAPICEAVLQWESELTTKESDA